MTNKVHGNLVRTLADGTKLYLPYRLMFNRRHYTGDVGETWTPDKAAAWKTLYNRKGLTLSKERNER